MLKPGRASETPPSRTLQLIALIAAGEAAFLLPFILPRIFRPTLLEVLDITNLQLGTAHAAYGTVAMIAYFGGGPLADRFPPRGLLITALLLTALGGLVMIRLPSLDLLVGVYLYWGITTIALFWAPLIKATRDWGGHAEQGRAFGLLDGGRGLLAALTGSLLVAVFALLLPVDPNSATLAERRHALEQIIFLLVGFTTAIAALLWLALPPEPRSSSALKRLSLDGLLSVVHRPEIRLQSLLILCAYVGFRSIDDFSLYAREVLGMNEVQAARVGVLSLWIRPFAAVASGFLADRYGSARMSLISFAAIAIASAQLASDTVASSHVTIFLLTIACSSLGVFGMRGLYFAIMQESQIPREVTGAAVGVVSLIGYTPDVFMGPLTGFLIDRSPGADGHQQVFAIVTAFALVGLVTSAIFERRRARNEAEDGMEA